MQLLSLFHNWCARYEEYLSDNQTNTFVKSLNEYLERKVQVPRVRMGKSQEIETLINKEALLFAMYLRNETELWKPRIAHLS